MGWMFCGQDDLGRDIGYGVDAECELYVLDHSGGRLLKIVPSLPDTAG